MALNPIKFLIATNATATSGSDVINITGNIDCSRVYSGTAIFMAGADTPVEAIAGTAPDGSGNSTITLRNNWPHGTIPNSMMVSFNTIEGLEEAIRRAREIVENSSAIEDLVGAGVLKRVGDADYEVLPISSQGESLIAANDAASQRSVLGLGTSATKNVSANTVDTSGEKRLLKYGDWGYTERSVFVGNNANIDEIYQPGKYYGYSQGHASAATGDNPFGGGGAFTLEVSGRLFGADDYVHQTACQIVGTTGIPYVKVRSYIASSGDWTPWAEMFHSINSINPVDFGFGIRNITTLTVDVNTLTTTGIYNLNSSSANLPISGGFYIVVDGASGTGFCSQTATLKTSGSPRKFFRSQNSGTWSSWVEIYHSGNTNFNEFGGLAAGDVICKNVTAISATQCRCEFNLNSWGAPTGIDVTSTFKLTTKGGADVDTNLSTFVLASLSSNKEGIVTLSGATGLTSGADYYLVAETASSKIVFNF